MSSMDQETLFEADSKEVSTKNLDWLKQVDYHLVDNPESMDHMLQHFQEQCDRGQKCIGMDTKTTALSYVKHHLVGLCLSMEEGIGYYVPVRHLHDTNLDEKSYLSIYQWIIDHELETVWFNAKFDFHFVSKDRGNDDFPFTHDVQMSLKLLFSNEKFHRLKDSAKRFFDIEMIDFMDNFKASEKKTANFATLSTQQAVNYAAADPDLTLRLHNKHFPEELVQKTVEYLPARDGLYSCSG